METITRRFLSRNTAQALALADRDGAVIINGRWTLVAGIPDVVDPLAGLVARGLVDPPDDLIPWGQAHDQRRYSEAEIDDLVAWGKGDH